jgi:hypothetical protein
MFSEASWKGGNNPVAQYISKSVCQTAVIQLSNNRVIQKSTPLSFLIAPEVTLSYLSV